MNATHKYLLEKLNLNPKLVVASGSEPITIKYSRYHILNLFKELNFKVGVEVGTEQGKYAAKIFESNPQVKLYCVDSWKAETYYHLDTKQEVMDAMYEEAKQRLASYDCEIMRMTSMEAVKKFKPNSIDFVFIDGNHNFEFVKEDIEHWSKIVKPGGIVYGHDYWDHNDVRRAVDEYIKTSEIKPWFILHRGGYMIPCWMYIRSKEDFKK